LGEDRPKAPNECARAHEAISEFKASMANSEPKVLEISVSARIGVAEIGA
jgi:hypothetical protein